MEPELNFPGFTVLKTLASGASSEVLLARAATGELVALKRVLARPLASGSNTATAASQGTLRGNRPTLSVAEQTKALRREAELLNEFTHPSLVRCGGVVETGEGPALVLEYAAGGDLRSAVKKEGPLPANKVIEIIGTLGSVLTVLHQAELYHGDLSPRNVLFSASRRAILADLGAARTAEATSTVCGTDGFLDPELAYGTKYSGSSDVYGLAAVAAYALIGGPIVSRDYWAEQARAAHAPPALVAALWRALAPHREERPELAELLTTVANVDDSHVHTRAVTPKNDEPVLTKRGRFTVIRVWLAATWARRPSLVFRGIQWRFTPRMFGVAAVAVLLVVGAGVAWVTISPESTSSDRAQHETNTHSQGNSAGRSAPENHDVATSAMTSPQWTDIITELDNQRAAAFEVADPQKLTNVYAPDSQPLRTDTQQISTMAANRHTARNVRHDMEVLSAEPDGDARVRLKVRDAMQAYEVYDSHGAVVQQVPAAEQRELVMTLTKVDGDWRIAEIETLN